MESTFSVLLRGKYFERVKKSIFLATHLKFWAKTIPSSRVKQVYLFFSMPGYPNNQRKAISGVNFPHHPGKGDGFANMFNACQPGYGSFHPQAKAAVGDRAIFS